jgi:hypothetical protein
MAGPSSDLWKWHRRLGHLSFDLVSHLSGLDLVRGLSRLKFEKDLVCAPCRHGKMVATPHPPLTDVMTERPTELLHMDLVAPARVRSVGGKWYVLTPKFGKESDLWVQLGKESVWRREGYLRCIRQKDPRSAICFRSAKEQLS